MKIRSLLLLPALLLSAPLMAQEGARDTGAYISGQTGNFRLESPNLDATGALQAVYAGYRFSPYFAVEGGWSYASGIGGGNPDDISGRVDYVSARAIGRYPFGEVAPGLSLIAGVGLHYIDMHMTYMGVSTADTDMRHGYLVGGEIDAERVTLRLVFEKLDIPNATESQSATLAVGWRF